MILFELVGREDHPTYQALQVSNGARQYDFLLSIVTASLSVDRPFLSSSIIKALNFHAIACLHTNAGEYRPCPVHVQTLQEDGTVKIDHSPPDSYRVQALMDDMVNMINRSWEKADSFALAAYVLWRLNWIHPFIQGNGRTARAAAYFVLCLKSGGLPAGKVILPELIKQHRPAYVEALRVADQTGDLAPLMRLLNQLMALQLSTADPAPVPTPAPAGEPNPDAAAAAVAAAAPPAEPPAVDPA